MLNYFMIMTLNVSFEQPPRTIPNTRVGQFRVQMMLEHLVTDTNLHVQVHRKALLRQLAQPWFAQPNNIRRFSRTYNSINKQPLHDRPKLDAFPENQTVQSLLKTHVQKDPAAKRTWQPTAPFKKGNCAQNGRLLLEALWCAEHCNFSTNTFLPLFDRHGTESNLQLTFATSSDIILKYVRPRWLMTFIGHCSRCTWLNCFRLSFKPDSMGTKTVLRHLAEAYNVAMVTSIDLRNQEISTARNRIRRWTAHLDPLRAKTMSNDQPANTLNDRPADVLLLQLPDQAYGREHRVLTVQAVDSAWHRQQALYVYKVVAFTIIISLLLFYCLLLAPFPMQSPTTSPKHSTTSPTGVELDQRCLLPSSSRCCIGRKAST